MAHERGAGRLEAAYEAALADNRRLQQELAAERALHVVLARELHHRVANNLELLSASARARWRRTRNPDVKVEAEAILAQVHAVARVHRRLMIARDNLNLADLLRDVCDQIAVLLDNRMVAIRVQAASLMVPPRYAFAAAAITSELVMNAIKHAFNDKPEGTIRVRLRADARNVSLTVADDGDGAAADHRSDGLDIIDRIAQTIGGHVSYGHGSGMVATVRLPAPRAPA